MRPPRGFKIESERVEDDQLVVVVKITRWRALLLLWQSARRWRAEVGSPCGRS